MNTKTETKVRTPREVEVAAEWWKELLRKGAIWDNGDATCNAATALIKSFGRQHEPILSETHFIKFRRNLIQGILERLVANIDSWNPEDPLSGASRRDIYIDYHAPELLMNAAKQAGITANGMITFGCKTCMHINPGCVKVGQGYGVEWVTLWEGHPAQRDEIEKALASRMESKPITQQENQNDRTE